jgi:hypothetical protein
MLDKTQQPTASRRATGRRAHGCKRGSRTVPLPAFLVTPIALLVLAAPASAAGPLTGVLSTVEKAAAPAVTQAASAPATLAPSPAAAQQAGDVAPRPAPVDRTTEHTTSSPTTSPASTVGSELTGASPHHDQTPAGAPADQSQSAPPPGEGPHAPGSTPPRAAGSGDSAGAPTSTASPQRPSGAVDGVVQGVALSARQVTSSAPHQTGVLPAPRGERQPLPSRLADGATAGTPARTVQRVVLAPGLLGASRALGDVGATVTQLVETPPVTIAPLLTPLARALTLPSLPELAVLPELPSLLALPPTETLPVLPTLPPLLAPPASPEQSPSPVLTPALPPAPSAPPQPIAPSPPADAARGGGADASSNAPPQGAWQASSPAQAYAATANILGVTGAPDRRGSTSSAAGALRRAASWAAVAKGATAAYGLPTSEGTALTSPGTASPGGAGRQPSPAPSPGGASPATGAAAGTSIPIFLTLAGLLLLAVPRVRRVLRLLGESWRLSPLALIPERPG